MFLQKYKVGATLDQLHPLDVIAVQDYSVVRLPFEPDGRCNNYLSSELPGALRNDGASSFPQAAKDRCESAIQFSVSCSLFAIACSDRRAWMVDFMAITHSSLTGGAEI